MKNADNLRKVQLIQFDILKETVRICKKNNLKYYLIGGSLIGAVRHKGFIPWDDDIDVAIPREDYDKFIQLATSQMKEKYKLEHYTINPNYRFYLLNVVDKTAKIVIQRVTPLESNVGIDILPIDGIPNNRFVRMIYKFKILYYRALAGLFNVKYIRDKKRSLIEKILIRIGKIINFEKILNIRKIREKNDKLVRKYKYDECEFVGTFFGNYGFHEIVPKTFFGKGSTVEFEKEKFNAPQHVHKYLTHMYGDYMKLPPESKRIGHHILKIIKKDD